MTYLLVVLIHFSSGQRLRRSRLKRDWTCTWGLESTNFFPYLRYMVFSHDNSVLYTDRDYTKSSPINFFYKVPPLTDMVSNILKESLDLP